MRPKKRLRTHIKNGDDNIKRKKVKSLSEESITHFEDLSNEIMYEIFEFLDFYHVLKAFPNVNKRFHNLTINSQLPIEINISSISKSNFEDYYKDIIIRYIHRIKLLCISNLFTVNIILSSFHNVSKFTRLETLILNNIEPPFLININYLTTLPRLYSLIIISSTNILDQANVFYQIFRLPVLRYCKVSFGQSDTPVLLPFATNNYSPIQHLVINNDVHLNLLYFILSYIPQLCRLSIHGLFDSSQKTRIKFPIVLNHLTHITLRLDSITFNTFELLVKNLFQNLQVLCISTRNDITYLDADRWQHLILSYMPNLSIFDLQYIYSIRSDQNVTSTYESLINKFNSSFWIERQWFFATQYPCGPYQNNIIFYSIRPYRRKTFTLDGIIKEKTNFDSVRHLHIKSIRSMINCKNHFPNTTKLSFTDHLDTICNSIGKRLTHIVPLQQITKIVIDYNYFSFTQLVQLLRFTTNVHTLKLASISLSEIDSGVFDRNITFQFVSITNSIKNVILEEKCSLVIVELLTALFPRLQRLTINGFGMSLMPIIRLLLSNNNNNTRHLTCLCISKLNDLVDQRTLKMTIKTEKLRDDYSIEFLNNKMYLWW